MPCNFANANTTLRTSCVVCAAVVSKAKKPKLV